MKSENLITILETKWQSFIAVLSLFAIVVYLILVTLDVAFARIPLLLLIVIGGVPLFLQIILKLLKGNFGADLLAAIALITGVILHEYLAASLIILMLASGQTLERYAQKKASSVLRALVSRMPNIAHRKIGSQIEDIPLIEIHINDKIVIYPHETSPVDGTVIEGNGSMDESYLTGEPYQISKAPGSSVLSGAINGESVLDLYYCHIKICPIECARVQPFLGTQLGTQN